MVNKTVYIVTHFKKNVSRFVCNIFLICRQSNSIPKFAKFAIFQVDGEDLTIDDLPKKMTGISEVRKFSGLFLGSYIKN